LNEYHIRIQHSPSSWVVDVNHVQLTWISSSNNLLWVEPWSKCQQFDD